MWVALGVGMGFGLVAASIQPWPPGFFIGAAIVFGVGLYFNQRSKS